MSVLKQAAIAIFVLLIALFGWVYLSPSAIDTLARYNMDFGVLKSLASVSGDEEGAGKGGASPRGRLARKALVTVTEVTNEVVNNRLTAIGSGRAIRSVTVTSLVSGQITKLPIASGSVVKQGAILAELDHEIEELARDRAALSVEDLRAKVSRAEQLLERKSISIVEVENARTELRSGEVALRGAKLAVSRRTIQSPIDGIVGIVSANIGDYVTNQSPIVIVEDRSKIVVEFFVPERFVTAIKLGAKVEASSIARPGQVFNGVVSAIDNRIDVASRTLRVRAELDNENDVLRGGMAFKVIMHFEGDRYSAVDPLAIQWDSKGSYVWQVDDNGKAVRQAARIIQRNPENVLIESALKVGDRVVAEGVQNVRAGGEVRGAGQESKREADAALKKAPGT